MSRKNSGIILITVLWAVAILSLLALSLSKGSSLELSLIRNSVGQVKAYAAARAGISYVQNLLEKNKTEDLDSLYQCGIKLPEGKKLEDVFKKVKIDPGVHFDIVVAASNYGLPKDQMMYGLEDEQGKINLNAVDVNTYKVFSKLLEQFGVSEMDANNLAAATIDWHSEGNVPFKGVKTSIEGAKDNYYLQLSTPYKVKNRPFDRTEELLWVRGMTQDTYKKIKDYITVVPQQPDQGFRINFNTASDQVIRAAVQGLLEGQEDDQDITNSLIQLRNGVDHQPFTRDDGTSKMSDISASQQLYINSLKSSHGTDTSEFFHVRSIGTDEATGTQCTITAVIHRSSTEGKMTMVEWHRE